MQNTTDIHINLIGPAYFEYRRILDILEKLEEAETSAGILIQLELFADMKLTNFSIIKCYKWFSLINKLRMHSNKKIRKSARTIYNNKKEMFMGSNTESKFGPAYKEAISRFKFKTQALGPLFKYLDEDTYNKFEDTIVCRPLTIKEKLNFCFAKTLSLEQLLTHTNVLELFDREIKSIFHGRAVKNHIQKLTEYIADLYGPILLNVELTWSITCLKSIQFDSTLKATEYFQQILAKLSSENNKTTILKPTNDVSVETPENNTHHIESNVTEPTISVHVDSLESTIWNPVYDSVAKDIKMKTIEDNLRQMTAICNPVYDSVAKDIKMETIEENLRQMHSTIDNSLRNEVVDRYHTEDLIECLLGNDSATSKPKQPLTLCDNPPDNLSPSGVKIELETSGYENEVEILDVSSEKPIVIVDSSDELNTLLRKMDDHDSDKLDSETVAVDRVPSKLNIQDKSPHTASDAKRKHYIENDLFNHKKQFTDSTNNVISNEDFMSSQDHSFFWSSQLGPIDKQHKVPEYSSLCSKSANSNRLTLQRNKELMLPSTKGIQIGSDEHIATPNRGEAIISSVPPEGTLVVSLDVEKIQGNPVEQQMTTHRQIVAQTKESEKVQNILPQNITQPDDQPTYSKRQANEPRNANESNGKNDINAAVVVSSTNTSPVQLLSNTDKSNTANKTVLLPLDYVQNFENQKDLRIITLANRPFKFKFKVINENRNEMLYKTPGFESICLNDDSAMQLLQLNKTHWKFVLLLMKQLGSFTFNSTQTTCTSLNILEKLLFFVFKSSQKMSINVGLMHTLGMDRASFVSNVYKYYRNIENELDEAVETLQNNLNDLYNEQAE